MIKQFLSIGLLTLSLVVSIAVSAACPKPKDVELVVVEEHIAIVCHDNWTSYYDTHSFVPMFVFYTITAEQTKAPQVKRPSVFTLDPMLADSLQAKSAWFTRSGYDRGHMYPNEDGNYDKDVAKRTFYMTNVAAQTPELNRGIWKVYEELIRSKSLVYGEVRVYIKVVYVEQISKVKEKSMAIPKEFIKVVVYGDTMNMYKFTNTQTSQVEDVNEQDFTAVNLRIIK